MKSYVYILFSKKLNRFYIGATHESLNDRIKKHNDHSYGNHRYTAAADDWTLYLSIESFDYSHAVRMERKIKSMKSSVYLNNLKQYPELQKKIIEETST